MREEMDWGRTLTLFAIRGRPSSTAFSDSIVRLKSHMTHTEKLEELYWALVTILTDDERAKVFDDFWEIVPKLDCLLHETNESVPAACLIEQIAMDLDETGSDRLYRMLIECYFLSVSPSFWAMLPYGLADRIVANFASDELPQLLLLLEEKVRQTQTPLAKVGLVETVHLVRKRGGSNLDSKKRELLKSVVSSLAADGDSHVSAFAARTLELLA